MQATLPSSLPRARSRRARGLALLLTLTSLSLVGQTLVSSVAWAQSQLGSIQGVVTADETGKPLSSVTVVVNGPALQEFQSEVTDASGRYVITQLPPGDDYQISFYFGADDKPRVVRPGIRLSLGKTVTVNANIRISAGKREVKVIRESAPNVDTASASTGVEINQEVLRNTPVRGRTFESVLALAPGAADVAPRNFSTTGGAASGTEVGVSMAGSSGNENNFIIDGVNTTDPNLGLVGSELSQYFIKEVNVITGGYQAEFGRATGGVVTIATKSGSNEFHGSVFGTIQPYQLDPFPIARLGDAIQTRTKTSTLFDFGFDLGGYLVKDHVWFYVGFAPTFTNESIQRRFRQQFFDPATNRAQTDPNFECPSYLRSSLYCVGASRAALRTQEIDGSGQDLARNKRLYNWIAKFQFNINPDHNITLGYIGSPVTYDDYVRTGSADINTQKYNRTDQIHDVSARYLGKLLNRKLELDILYGFHYQTIDERPGVSDTQQTIYRAGSDNPYSLSDFEDVPGCQRQTIGGTSFNPCPITKYYRGMGLFRQQELQRHMLLASATGYIHFTDKWNPLRGVHAIKIGFNFEQVFTDSTRAYTGTDLNPNDPSQGHRIYQTSGDGTAAQITREFGTRGADGNPIFLDKFRGLTQTRNFAVYLRDSWQVDWAPGLVLNLGVRWEGQEIYGMNFNPSTYDPNNVAVGDKVISIYDNWAPRIGIAYDFTQLTNHPGRGKVYFNYGRFYESIPTDINDRQFTGEGLYSSGYSGSCPNTGSMARPVLNASASACNYQNFPGLLNGGSYGQVAPGLKGQYINEIVLGLDYDVGLDIVLGISYIHRDLGNIIEDMSTDGGSFYIIANPGNQADPNLVNELQGEIDRLAKASMANPNDAKAAQDLATAQGRLASYQTVGTLFPRARRNYDALVLKLTKRFSNRFSIISSYAYSRTLGNYPGTFSPSNGQLDPNISSQFDLVDLLANRNGPLSNDRPHNFKATGFYEQPIGDKVKLTFGLTFSAFSGRPIEVLGSHLYYGQSEVFILPRGAGGRTPPVTQFDLSVGYEHKLTRIINLRLSADIINLFNQQAVTNIDDDYTYDVVSAIINGQPDDLRHLKRADGGIPTYNSNYGQPTAYQQPLYFRFGGRLSF